MKIVVCVRQGLDGLLSPFDAAALEEALSIPQAEVTLLSMGPASAKDFLLSLTRLGAPEAILLSDSRFAGADTLATAYTLSLAVRALQPDLVFCGRQTLIGDTGQTGPMLSVFASLSSVSNVMRVDAIGPSAITCTTRSTGQVTASLPALLTFERTRELRLPSLFSRTGSVSVWDAEHLSADPARIGLVGSPTRVLESFENRSGKRKCQWISFSDLTELLEREGKRQPRVAELSHLGTEKLGRVLIVGPEPREFAEAVCDEPILIPFSDPEEIAERILREDPDAVLWPSDDASKEAAARTAALLRIGLCADLTAVQVENGQLMMIRPALSGSRIAKIQSLTRPAMATVRTAKGGGEIILAAGYGVRDRLDAVRSFAERIGAELCCSRKMVDNGFCPYPMQVGLTGRTVAPRIYLAVGISGAVHHLAGMQRSGCVIAINPDPQAEIFEYADYGIVSEFIDQGV